MFLSPGKETEGHTLGFWPLTEDTCHRFVHLNRKPSIIFTVLARTSSCFVSCEVTLQDTAAYSRARHHDGHLFSRVAAALGCPSERACVGPEGIWAFAGPPAASSSHVSSSAETRKSAARFRGVCSKARQSRPGGASIPVDPEWTHPGRVELPLCGGGGLPDSHTGSAGLMSPDVGKLQPRF